MIISDKIYISPDEAITVDPSMFPLLTYRNPDFFQKMNMGISVHGIPKEIRTYVMKNGAIEIPRGEALRVKQFIGHLPYNFQHPDRPFDHKLQYINDEFDLDEYQTRAIDSMMTFRQGIVHAVTSAGKSLIILKAIVELGQKAVIVVHRKVLMTQLLEDIDKYIRDENGNKIVPGVIGNGRCHIGDITISIDKSLAKHAGRFREEWGVLILDECHLAPAQTLYSLINSINTRNRYGLSGTLRRKDQKEFLIYATFGSVIATIGKEELLEKGRVVPVQPIIIESETRFDWDQAVEMLESTTKARHLQEKTIMLDPARNHIITHLTSTLPGKTIILSRYVDHCYSLQNELREKYGIEAGIITGRDGKKAQEAYGAMKHEDLRVIVATIGCVSTGLSISDLNNIVLASPLYTNELLLHQIRGRLMRTSEGKTHGTLYFIHDQYIFEQRKLNQFLKIMKS